MPIYPIATYLFAFDNSDWNIGTAFVRLGLLSRLHGQFQREVEFGTFGTKSGVWNSSKAAARDGFNLWNRTLEHKSIGVRKAGFVLLLGSVPSRPCAQG